MFFLERRTMGRERRKTPDRARIVEPRAREEGVRAMEKLCSGAERVLFARGKRRRKKAVRQNEIVP